jgi:ATP-dependent helicase/nuclease subunit A
MPSPERFAARTDTGVSVRAPFQAAASVSSEERLSVTELIEGDERQMDAADLLRRSEAQSAGTRIHRALEALKYGAGESGGEDDPAVRYVMELETPRVRDWIREGHPEWGFQVKTSSRVIEGQIDLWAKHDGTLYVVDYKSGSMKQKEAAFRQLGLYAWALRKFGHKEPAKLVVVYPLARKTEIRDFSESSFLSWEAEFGGT